MKPTIELERACCKAGGRVLLFDINWTVNEDDKWILFGENGCGKTTLLSLVLGYRKLSSGTLRLFGEEFDPKRVLEYRRRIGWVSTSFFQGLYGNESVRDVILSGKSGTLGVSERIGNRDLVRAREMAARFNVEEQLDLPYSTLSKGQQQCALLARGLFHECEALFLDEAESGLDFVARDRLNRYVEELSDRRSLTVVCVTHYPNEIPSMYRKCLLLKSGRCVAQGAIGGVLRPDVLSGYFGRPIDVDEGTGLVSVSHAEGV